MCACGWARAPARVRAWVGARARARACVHVREASDRVRRMYVIMYLRPASGGRKWFSLCGLLLLFVGRFGLSESIGHARSHPGLVPPTRLLRAAFCLDGRLEHLEACGARGLGLDAGNPRYLSFGSLPTHRTPPQPRLCPICTRASTHGAFVDLTPLGSNLDLFRYDGSSTDCLLSKTNTDEN